MKKLRRKTGFLSIVFFLLAFAGGCRKEALPEPEPEPVFTECPELMEKAAEQVVRLEIFDEAGQRIAVGSGFLAIGGNYLVTSAHVVEHMVYAIATEDSGQTFRIERLVGCDDVADVAVLEYPERAQETFLPTNGELPLRGEKVAAIGTTAGFVNLVTLGNVSKIWEIGGMNRILFTAPVSSGNSGGPLLNDKGEVIGVVMGTYDYADNLNVAISIQEVINLLDSKE